MKATATRLPGALVFDTPRHHDARGHFQEAFRQRDFDLAVGRPTHFVQDNLIRSHRGVLRGLHYQADPHAMGKLVRVVHGRIFDVVVDLRFGSASFGQWLAMELSDDDGRMLWVPPGLAHGMLVLSERADVAYKCTAYHAPQAEHALRWDDAALGITWPLEDGREPILSARDAQAPGWDQVPKFNMGSA
jgi:dTDP-4-dehydrorhamnose 3,5-epimerase